MTKAMRINLVLFLALITCILLINGSGRDLTKTNVEYMPDMVYGAANESFSRNTVFANGITMQTPPDGSIARGRMPFRYLASAEEALRAGRELQSPVDLQDTDLLKRGAFAFGVFCQPCHGGSGKGDGPIAAKGYPPPPSLLIDHAIAMQDGQIFHVQTFGQGNMPGHRSQISTDDRWAIVGHLRKLQSRALEKQQEAQLNENADNNPEADSQ